MLELPSMMWGFEMVSCLHVLYKYQRGNFKYRFQSENPLPNPSRCTVICSSVCVCVCVCDSVCVPTCLRTHWWICIRLRVCWLIYTLLYTLLNIIIYIYDYIYMCVCVCRACVHLSLSLSLSSLLSVKMDFQSNLVKLAAWRRPKIISNQIRSIYIVVMLKPDFL